MVVLLTLFNLVMLSGFQAQGNKKARRPPAFLAQEAAGEGAYASGRVRYRELAPSQVMALGSSPMAS
jgi:hypothetical protein